MSNPQLEATQRSSAMPAVGSGVVAIMLAVRRFGRMGTPSCALRLHAVY